MRPTGPTSRRSKRISSRSTSRASACSSRRSATSSSKARASSTSAACRPATVPGDVPILFFSRQIGLSSGQAVPVVGGARLTGRTGPYSIGLLNIQTDDDPAARAVSTNFTAMRFKRNLFRRSNVGVIATRRGPGSGRRDRAGCGRQLQPGRRRDDAVLQEHQPDGLLRAHQHADRAGRHDVWLELSRSLRLHRRSLRRARRSTC